MAARYPCLREAPEGRAALSHVGTNFLSDASDLDMKSISCVRVLNQDAGTKSGAPGFFAIAKGEKPKEIKMKKFLIPIIASAALVVPTLAHAQIIKNSNEAEAGGAVVGGTAGGVTGAVVGGLIFGPIGAAIGGFTGATIGASAGVEASSVDYVRLHPTDPVVIDGQIDVGYAVPEAIVIHPIEGDAAHGYFYTQDRVYFVDLSNRTVVYSPGVVVAAE